MFNLGAPEVLVIAVLALLVLGPQRLPDAARQIGNMMGEIRKLSSGFQKEMKSAFDAETEDAARKRGAALTQPTAVDDIEAAPPLLGAMPPVDAEMPPLVDASPGEAAPTVSTPTQRAAARKAAAAESVAPSKKVSAKKAASKEAAPAKKAVAKKAAPVKKAVAKKAAPAKRAAVKKSAG